MGAANGLIGLIGLIGPIRPIGPIGPIREQAALFVASRGPH